MWLVVFGEFQVNPGYLHKDFIFAQTLYHQRKNSLRYGYRNTWNEKKNM